MAHFYGDLAAEVGSDMESDISDVNPNDMAKALPDLDDLDDALFKTSKKPAEKSKSPFNENVSGKIDTPPAAEGSKESKGKNKKLADDDFDWDDSLAEIFSSDESTGKSKEKRKKSLTASKNIEQVKEMEPPKEKLRDKTHKGKLIADLFGLDDTFDKNKKQPSKEEADFPKADSSKLTEGPKSLDSYLDKDTSNVPDTSLPSESNFASEKPAMGKITEKVSAQVGRMQSSLPQKKKGNASDEDLLAGLGLEREKKADRNLFLAKSSSTKAKVVLDDLFSATEKVVSDDTMKESKASNQESSVSFGKYAPSLGSNRESRRPFGRRNTSAIGDPLGIFSPPDSPKRSMKEDITNENQSTPIKRVQEEEKTDWLGISAESNKSLQSEQGRSSVGGVSKDKPSGGGNAGLQSQNTEDLPEWLGGSGVKTSRKAKMASAAAAAPAASNPAASVATTGQTVKRESRMLGDMEVSYEAPEALPPEEGAVLEPALRAEAAVAQAMQMQEQQLLAALQLRQHELHLADTHQRQQQLLQRQEQQMQQLLTQQVERQRRIEEQLQMQQQRITTYMQALLSQSPIALPKVEVGLPEGKAAGPKGPAEHQKTSGRSSPIVMGDSNEKVDRKEEAAGIEVRKQLTELQVALQECELEKKALESAMENVKTKHTEEIKLMEDCYKRQISIVEEAMQKQEQRLKAENDRLEADYRERLTKAQEQQTSLVEQHAAQLAALQKDHLADLQALKNQHSALLEHVRHIQQAETAAIKDASLNITTLQNTVEQLERNTDNLNEMQEWIGKQCNVHSDIRETSLKAKEAEISAYRESLTKQREAAEADRRKLLGLVEQLEMQVAEQRTKAEEEHYTLRQDAARLEARVQAFEKEKERLLAQVERERQHLDRARQVLLEEQKIVTQQFKDEKLNIARERVRLESLQQIQGIAASNQEQVLQLKAEAEAALAVAREATQHIEDQNNALQEQQRSLDKERHQLQERDSDLSARAHELEAISKAAMATKKEGAEALACAMQMEEQQAQRALELQKQLNEIKEREQRLARERMALSQERMKMFRSRDQRCSTCKNFLSGVPPPSVQPYLMSGPNKFVDPKVVILRLVAEKERDGLLSNSSASLTQGQLSSI